MAEEKILSVVKKEEDVEKERLETGAEAELKSSSTNTGNVLSVDERKELIKGKVELCQKNKLLRQNIKLLRWSLRTVERSLIEEKKRSQELKEERIFFTDFISELKMQNETLEVSSMLLP